jgi:hypothetical protein
MKEKEEANKWISVKDELPKHATKVIISHRTSNGRDDAMGCYHEDVQRWVYFDSTFEHDLEVEHWMPLPEPPK